MNRTLKPVTRRKFDRHNWTDFTSEEVAARAPQKGFGASEHRKHTENGEEYSLTRVTMPDGEIRRFARQYNGYGEPHSTPSMRANAMRFACAWSPVEVR